MTFSFLDRIFGSRPRAQAQPTQPPARLPETWTTSAEEPVSPSGFALFGTPTPAATGETTSATVSQTAVTPARTASEKTGDARRPRPGRRQTHTTTAEAKFALCVKPTQSGKTFELVESVKKHRADGVDLQIVFAMNLLLNAEQTVSRLAAGLASDVGGGGVVSEMAVVASRWTRPVRTQEQRTHGARKTNAQLDGVGDEQTTGAANNTTGATAFATKKKKNVVRRVKGVPVRMPTTMLDKEKDHAAIDEVDTTASTRGSSSASVVDSTSVEELFSGEDDRQAGSGDTTASHTVPYTVVPSLKKLSGASLSTRERTAAPTPPKVLLCLSNSARFGEIYELLRWLETRAAAEHAARGHAAAKINGGARFGAGDEERQDGDGDLLQRTSKKDDERFSVFRDVRSVVVHHDELHNYIDWDARSTTTDGREDDQAIVPETVDVVPETASEQDHPQHSEQQEPTTSRPFDYLHWLLGRSGARPTSDLQSDQEQKSTEPDIRSLRSCIEQACDYSVVRKVIGYTATPQPLVEGVAASNPAQGSRPSSIWTAPHLQKLDASVLERSANEYHGTQNMHFVDVERESSAETITDYVGRVLRERASELFPPATGNDRKNRNGNRIFLPAGMKIVSHSQVRQTVFEICPTAVVVVLNGEEKTIIWHDVDVANNKTLQKFSRDLGRDAFPGLELADKIERTFDAELLQNNAVDLYSRHLVITGYLCLGMGQTLLCKRVGNFTHAVLAERSRLELEKLYQLCGRLTGMCRRWGTSEAVLGGTSRSKKPDKAPADEQGVYSRTRVFCPVSVRKGFCEMEAAVVREMERAVVEDAPRLGVEGRHGVAGPRDKSQGGKKNDISGREPRTVNKWG